MKTIQIELLHNNGKPFDTAEISFILDQPKLLIIDGKHYVRQNDLSNRYQHEIPKEYKTRATN